MHFKVYPFQFSIFGTSAIGAGYAGGAHHAAASPRNFF